jgi:hypothetical protein
MSQNAMGFHGLIERYNCDLCCTLTYINNNNIITPWPESESELYRTSDSSLSAKLVPTFADIGFL